MASAMSYLRLDAETVLVNECLTVTIVYNKTPIEPVGTTPVISGDMTRGLLSEVAPGLKILNTIP